MAPKQNRRRNTIEGNITAENYMKQALPSRPSTIKPAYNQPGYHAYTDGTSTVWVGIPVHQQGVCQIGEKGYASWMRRFWMYQPVHAHRHHAIGKHSNDGL